MHHLSRIASSLLLMSVSACGGIADAGPAGEGDGDAARPGAFGKNEGPRPGSGDGDGGAADLCLAGEERSCVPPPDCGAAHQECLPSGEGWGQCSCDVYAGVGGSASHPTVTNLPSDFIIGGRGTAGDWDGYLFTAAEAESAIWPSEIVDSSACVAGTLAPGYEQWAMVGWNIGQEIDPETLAGLTPHAILPGGRGVEVLVVNGGSSRLRIVLQADDTGTESWCAPLAIAGGEILWSEFRKECWAPGGEFYDGATPISVVGVQTYSESDTLPTAFDFCVPHLGPVW